ALMSAMRPGSAATWLGWTGDSNVTTTRTLPSRWARERISAASGDFCDNAGEICCAGAANVDAKRSAAAAVSPRAVVAPTLVMLSTIRIFAVFPRHDSQRLVSILNA